MDMLTTTQAAEFLKQKPATLENWRSQGRGPKYYKPSGTVFYLKEDLIEWVKSGAVENE